MNVKAWLRGIRDRLLNRKPKAKPKVNLNDLYSVGNRVEVDGGKCTVLWVDGDEIDFLVDDPNGLIIHRYKSEY